jgi:hypothetical protein
MKTLEVKGFLRFLRLLYQWGLIVIVGIFAGLAIVSCKDVQECVADGIFSELELDWLKTWRCARFKLAGWVRI